MPTKMAGRDERADGGPTPTSASDSPTADRVTLEIKGAQLNVSGKRDGGGAGGVLTLPTVQRDLIHVVLRGVCVPSQCVFVLLSPLSALCVSAPMRHID